MPMLKNYVIVIILILTLSGCTSSSGAPGIYYLPGVNPSPEGDEEIVRGVVNGIYNYNPEKTRRVMIKFDEHLQPEEIERLSQQYVVRVGIDRAPPIVAISPIYFGFRFSDNVILPEGWTSDPHTISEERNVINVGDVVDIRTQKGRAFDYAVSLVRKCFEPPAKDENPDWDLGCKTYEKYNSKDYAGEQYFFRPF